MSHAKSLLHWSVIHYQLTFEGHSGCGWKKSIGLRIYQNLNSLKFARERSGSVVECLTLDRGAAGSSLTGVTALWSLSKTHLS